MTAFEYGGTYYAVNLSQQSEFKLRFDSALSGSFVGAIVGLVVWSLCYRFTS